MVSVSCPSCGSRFGIPREYLGRKVMCPRCRAVVCIPEAAVQREPTTPTPQPHPAQVGAAGAAGDPATCFWCGAGIQAHQRQCGSCGMDLAPSGGPSAPLAPIRRRGPKTTKILVVGGAAVALCTLVVVLLVVLLPRGSEEEEAAASMSQALPEEVLPSDVPASDASAGLEPALLVMDWPEADRAEAAVFIEDRPHPVPARGAVQYQVEPGRWRVVVRREGYQEIEKFMSFAPGQDRRWKPEFVKEETGPRYETRSFLDGKVSLEVPVDFGPMPEQLMSQRFPSEDRPEVVLSGEDGTVNVALGHKKGTRLGPDEFSKIMETTKSRVEAADPFCEWLRSEMTVINGHDCHVFDYRGKGTDKLLRAIIIFTSLEDSLLGVTFTCDASLEDLWVPIGNHMIQSVQVHR